MSLRLRRGTNDERATRVFDLAEPVWVTDKQQLWIGNGTGSVDPIASYAGTGLSYSYNSTNGGRLSVNLGALNTDSLPQGGTNKYFASQLAQDAFAELLSNGTQTGIIFAYDPIAHSLDADVDLGAFLVSTDTSPSLGGDLDLNGSDITGSGNIDITGSITFSNGTYGVYLHPRTGGAVIKSIDEELVLEGSSNEGAVVRINVKPASTTAGAILSGVANIQALQLRSYKNGATAPNPGEVSSGDLLSGILFSGWQNSTLSDIPAILGVQVDPAGTLTSSHVPTKFFFGNQASLSGDPPVLMTFDSKGRLAINKENATATLDVNGIMRLTKQSAAPASPAEGMIAVADRVNWDPAMVGSGGSYPVYFDGTTWSKLT